MIGAMPLDLSRQIAARWRDPDPSHAPLLKQAQIEAVLMEQPNEAFERACAEAGIATAPASAASEALSKGLWPGIRGGPNADDGDEMTASASRDPWIDANGYLVALERALRPGKAPVLGYLPNEKAGLAADRVVPFSTLEVALAEARMAGGNYVLALEPRYRAALLGGDPKAIEAWKQLGVTAAWLRRNADLFGHAAMPAITMLVDGEETTAELANLAYRRNVCPAPAPSANPPAPDPERIACLCAAGIAAPTASIRARILAHAEAGATVVADAPGEKAWWRDARLKRVKDEGDRDQYALGKGRVIGYRAEIVDPSEFALDLIDFATHRKRAARLWNANTVIPVATSGRRKGEALLHLVNYGQPLRRDVQAHIRGHFAKAALHRPGAAPLPLKTARRGAATEVFLPGLECAGTIVFG